MLRIVEAILVENERVGDRADLQQAMPIRVITRQQRCRKLFSCLGVGFAQSRGGLAPGSLAVDKVA